MYGCRAAYRWCADKRNAPTDPAAADDLVIDIDDIDTKGKPLMPFVVAVVMLAMALAPLWLPAFGCVAAYHRCADKRTVPAAPEVLTARGAEQACRPPSPPPPRLTANDDNGFDGLVCLQCNDKINIDKDIGTVEARAMTPKARSPVARHVNTPPKARP